MHRDRSDVVIEASRLGELVGKTLLGRSGVRVGKVTRVYEGTGGEGTFAAVRTGLFGGHASFVPLAEAELHGDNVHVPYPKELVDEAPRVPDDQELGPADEDRLYAHYGLAALAPAAAAPPAGDGTMTRSEEQLHVGTERVETGRARLRKYVVTETVTRTVPVSHEELRVVREPLAPGDPDVPQVDELSEEVHEVVLSAERPVVQKEVVPVERIRLATETITGEETVTEQVRKEQVEVLPDLPPPAVVPPAPPAAETSSELFVAPREVEDSGTSSEFFIAPREAEPKQDSGSSSELFVAPREAEPKQDSGSSSELFIAPREAEPKQDSGSSSELFIAPRESEPKQDDETSTKAFGLPREEEGGTSSELFLAPREAEPKDDSGTTSEFFLAPREDTPPER